MGAPLFVFWREEEGLNTERTEEEHGVHREEEENPKSGPGKPGPYKWEGYMELTEGQMRVVERLFGAGFRPIAIAPYESGLIMRKGECVALLGPVENAGLKLLAPVTFLVDGNLSVRLKRGNGEVFVWKKKEVAATEEKLKELEEFRVELAGILEMEKKSS